MRNRSMGDAYAYNEYIDSSKIKLKQLNFISVIKSTLSSRLLLRPPKWSLASLLISYAYCIPRQCHPNLSLLIRMQAGHGSPAV
jgi:hypothetical protein